MIKEKTTKQFEYYPGNDIKDGDFVISGGFTFSTNGVNLGYNAARMDILLPELFAEEGVGLEGEKILRDGFEKILLGRVTAWKITDIQPLPDSLRMCFCHEHAELVQEECDDDLSIWEKRNAKKILKLFGYYEINVVLRFTYKKGYNHMSFCLTFEDSKSYVCFSAWRNYNEIMMYDSSHSNELQYKLTWADEDCEDQSSRKIHATIRRKFKF